MKKLLVLTLAFLTILTACTANPSTGAGEPEEDDLPVSVEPTDSDDVVEPEQPESSEVSAEPSSSTAPASSSVPPVSSSVPPVSSSVPPVSSSTPPVSSSVPPVSSSVPPVSSSVPPVSSSVPPVSSSVPPASSSVPPVSSSVPPVASSAAPAAAAVPEVSAGNGEFLGSLERSILSEINIERKALGLNPVTSNASLKAAAAIRSKEMYVNDYFAHTRPDGREWQTVIKEDSYYNFSTAGENLGSYYTDYYGDTDHLSSSYWFGTWKNSPTHYAIIKTPEFTEVGISVYKVEVNGTIEVFATTIFACPK